MLRRFAAAALVASAATSLVGCSSTTAVPSVATTAEPTAPHASAVPIKAMTIDQKRQLIAENFQPEVPVPFGEVVRGKAQGNTAWDYELIVAAPPGEVALWYQGAYLGREWQLAEQTSPTPGSLTLTLTKNAAETRVTITPEGSGSSRVKAVLGVGAPVLQTQ